MRLRVGDDVVGAPELLRRRVRSRTEGEQEAVRAGDQQAPVGREEERPRRRQLVGELAPPLDPAAVVQIEYRRLERAAEDVQPAVRASSVRGMRPASAIAPLLAAREVEPEQVAGFLHGHAAPSTRAASAVTPSRSHRITPPARSTVVSALLAR